MYKLHLILKYLRKRRIAWVSLFGVMLCTAMVLVVISVMGGWLETFKSKFRGMSGDVVIRKQGLAGFSGYEQMIDHLKAQPEVEEAVPIIQTFGLLNIVNQRVIPVQVTGLDIDKFGKFNAFRESLWLQYQEPKLKGEAPTESPSFDLRPGVDYQDLRRGDPKALERPGMIVGGPLIDLRKNKQGKVEIPPGNLELWARLEVVPIGTDFRSATDIQPVANIYWIVDASRTQVWQLDENAVYVPFDVVQRDLGMDARPITIDGKQMLTPKRCHEIQIKCKPGVDRDAFIDRITPVITDLGGFGMRIQTWEKEREKFLGAVENEKLLMTILFGVISVVAVFLIFCILYMIVVEKTRDIGIIKSVGATSQGVAMIFVGYGLAIGVVGGVGGLITGGVFLYYINEIHSFIARVSGRAIWDPEVYAFDSIPNTMDPTTACVVVTVAILSATLGAVVPAIRAARFNPVEALRFE